MANSLLDFVMSLVRDPDAAARYAADPSQAIADAHLTDVTSVDVNNLIPVVSESLSMTAPTGGLDSFAAEPAGNVWASGAATAAFDAFDDHVPVDTAHDLTRQVIDQPDHVVSSGMDTISDAGLPQEPLHDASLQFSEPLIDEAPAAVDHVIDADWAQPVVDDMNDLHHNDGGAGFDLFD